MKKRFFAWIERYFIFQSIIQTGEIVIFTMNRTGSTSACRSLFSINELIHKNYYENPEFLHSINTYLPPDIKYWIQLVPQIYDAYKLRDYEFLNTWYATTSDKLVPFMVEKPILKEDRKSVV